MSIPTERIGFSNYDVEASTLGLPPGTWPASVAYGGVAWYRGAPVISQDGELVAYDYTTTGALLRVWND